MLHLNSENLTNDSKTYLLSVLIDPEEILNIVTKRFEVHFNDLSCCAPCEANTTRVRSVINLLSKDIRLMLELNRSMIDLTKSCEIKVFSDDYLDSIVKRFELAMEIFKENKDV